MSDPLATVAMVTYNSERYVAEAIESVLCSNYQHFELVICDDASLDDTWNIVQQYSDPRIRSFRNPRNLGEYANRRRALELAEGQYFIYIDGDDILYPHGLGYMVRMLDAFPEAAIAVARPWSEKFVYPVQLSPREVYLCEFLGSSVLGINFAHLLFRTCVLREGDRIDERFKTGDTYIQLAIALRHPVLLISDGLAWWRRTPGQASDSLLRNHLNSLESIIYKRELLRHRECPLTLTEIETARANIYGGFIRIALRFALRGRISHAVYLLRQAHIPLAAWRFMFVRGCYDHMRDLTAARPRASELKRNPFAVTPHRMKR